MAEETTTEVPERGIISVSIEDEMTKSYMDYAMSVIIGRALPLGRDGLKPVHRRILYAMYREGLLSTKRYSKSAGVVGEVLKKYHPHGDQAVYQTMVRMAQDWSLRYPLIDGQGNFGSIDGDAAAAYRYTEARLTKLAEAMLDEIDQDTVDFVPNFDGSTTEPVWLPTKIPNLLINGSTGIAVGMATSIPPHNLNEVIDACVHLVDHPDATVHDIMKIIPGPDFPTAGFICGRGGIRQAYETGHGSLVMRAKVDVEIDEKKNRERLIVTEIPYLVTKSTLVEQIAQLVMDGRIEGISDIRDESNKEGIRVVIELKREQPSEVVLNQLYKHTALQTSFGIHFLCISDQQPRLLNIKQLLELFIDHRKEVIVRRTRFELRRAEERAHILEGLRQAIGQIDAVIALIKKAKTPDVARDGLIGQFSFSTLQAQAILDMRLQRLTGLEIEKVEIEHKELQGKIVGYRDVLKDEKRVLGLIKKEMEEVKAEFGDARRTQFMEESVDLHIEDLITEEDMVVTVSHMGYVKRNPVDTYRTQKRGGVGKAGAKTREEDFVEEIFVASTHAYLMIFTNFGKVYWKKVHEIPIASRTAIGKPLAGLIKFEKDEKAKAIVAVRDFVEGSSIIMATRNGIVKKTDLMEFSNPRPSGIIALRIDENDTLIGAKLVKPDENVLLSTNLGKSIQFKESDVRVMGRAARGVYGIDVSEGDQVVSIEIVQPGMSLLTVTTKGYGKRTSLEEYRIQSRGGKGIITIKTTEKNGEVVSSQQVKDTDSIMIITDRGTLLRMAVSGIPVIGRNTQGVRLIKLEPEESVASVAVVREDDETKE